MALHFCKASLLLVAALFTTPLLGSAGSPALIPGFNECIFNSRRYAFGEVFHPVVEVDGVSQSRLCIRCTCQPTTIVQCENVQCPPANCSNPEPTGQCCLVCLEPDIAVGPPVCTYEGVQYVDQEKFHPPSKMQAYHNGSSTDNPFCTECQCINGEVECRNTSSECPALECDEADAEAPEGECCMECPSTSSPPDLRRGCRDPIDGRFFEEGDSWHPTIPAPNGVLTPVTCMNCTCDDSQARCVRLPCPEVPPCGPNEPVEDFVICCPKCRQVPATPTATSLPSSVPTPEPSSNDTNDTSDTSPTADISPDIVPCETPYIYKIYKHANYDSMAIENTKTERVGIYTWTAMASGNSIRREYEEISQNEFNKRQYRVYFFVGWTLQRRVNGLSTRPQKREKIENCRQRCSQMVVNMLRPIILNSETLACSDS